MNEKRIKILGEGPILKSIFAMSMPVVLGMLVYVFYNLVDMFFVGKLNDTNQLAAINVTTPLIMLIISIAGIIGTGGAAYISRCLGEKNYDRANKTMSLSIVMCIIIGIVVTILGTIFMEPLVRCLGVSEQIFPYAYSYSSIIIYCTVILMLNYTFSQLIRSEGAAFIAMVGMIIGTVVNVVLDPILIFKFNQGIDGAAWATIIGNAVALLYYIAVLAGNKTLVKFSLKNIALDKKMLKEIFFIGIPASVNQFLLTLAVLLGNNFAVAYGDDIVAAMGTALKVITIGTYIFMGFSVGCQPLIGYNYGAKNVKRVTSVINNGIVITTITGILLTLTFALFARPIIGIFSEVESVVSGGIIILHGLMWSLPIVGVQTMAPVVAQSVGKGGASLVLSILRQGVIYIPVLFILNKVFGFQGLVYAQALTDLISLVPTVIILRAIMKDIKESFEEDTVLTPESSEAAVF